MSRPKIGTKRERRLIRARRGRGKIAGTLARPRLSIFRSNRRIYAQLIDDVAGRTLLGLGEKGKASAAKQLGLDLAKQALAKKITQVVFDRGGYRYAGRVKVLADGARAGGLIF